jgi:hypothetical protein
MRWIRSNAVALAALFFALGGTGFAADSYIITSTSQIKPSVLRKLRHVEVREYLGKPGVTGPAGATGPAGPQGPKAETEPRERSGGAHEIGEGGPPLYEMTGPEAAINTVGKSEAVCPEGEHAVGGGGRVTGSSFLTASRPADGDRGWLAEAAEDESRNGEGDVVQAYAVCQKVRQVVYGVTRQPKEEPLAYPLR